MTRVHRLALLSIPLLVVHGQASAAPPVVEFAPGTLVDPLACAAAPGQSYALYLPSAYTPERRWPILYAFDARRRGRLAAEGHQAAAEELGWIIASSNNSRSDESMDPNVEAMKAMWLDTHTRFSIDPKRAYTTGFSGGARAAVVLAMAQRGSVAGVIGHGGGFPFDWPPAKDTPFAFYGLAGWLDFNYPELLNLDQQLANLGLDHHFEPFEGEHEWAPPVESRDALAWMELAAMRREITARRQGFIDAEWRRIEARAHAAEAGGDPVLALRHWEGMSRDFGALRDVAPAQAEAARLRASEAWQREARAQEAAETAHARYVENARQRLAEFLREEPGSVRPERAAAALDVPALQRRAAADPTLYARRAAQRSLEALYVQTSFYVPREYLARKDYERALLCLGLAARVKPEEPWSWLALARGRAEAGDERGAVDALRTAAQKGLRDARRLREEPAFARLQQRKDFRAVLAQVEAGASSP